MFIDAENTLKQQITKHFEIEKYLYLIDGLKTVDVSKDKTYQTAYDYFWNVRRNEKWRNGYFKILQLIKTKEKPVFSEIVEQVSNLSINAIEPSFSSKILATIDPNMPIWDSRVLNKLHLQTTWEGDKTIENAIEMYGKIVKWYEDYLKKPEARENILIFDSYLPEYKDRITDVKKIDYLLWGG